MGRNNRVLGAKKPPAKGRARKRAAKSGANNKGGKGKDPGVKDPKKRTRPGIRVDQKPGKPTTGRGLRKSLPQVVKPRGGSGRRKTSRTVRAEEKVGRRKPVKPARKPAKPIRKPVKPARKPAKPIHKPVKPTRKPAKPIRKTAKPTRKPARPIRKPVKPIRKPAKPARKPVKPTRKPARPIRKPVKPTRKPAKPIRKPVKPARKPAKPARKPAKPIRKPILKPIPKPIRKPVKAAKPRRKPKPKPKHPRDEKGFLQAQMAAQGTIVDYLHLSAARLRTALPQFHYNVSDFANKDGSVDGELMISGLKGDDWEKFFILNASAASRGLILIQGVLAPLKDFWIATFALFGSESFDDVMEMRARYEKYKGTLVQGTYYHSMDYNTIDKMIRAVQAILKGDPALEIPGFIDTYGVPPSSFVIRLSWNPFNTNPLTYK